MRSPRWDSDEALLEDLRDALATTGAVSGKTVQDGMAALCWRTIDEDLELAGLVYDSTLDEQLLVRAADAARTLVFEAAPLSIEVEIAGGAVIGQIVPPGPGDVWLLTTSGDSRHAAADDLGCFTLPGPVGGSIRLRCETETGKLVTDWFRP